MRAIREWWASEGEATHEGFQIIVRGRELSYPWMRLCAGWTLMFAAGYFLAKAT